MDQFLLADPEFPVGLMGERRTWVGLRAIAKEA